MTDQQINEGVKEIVLALLSMAANAYTVNYVYNVLEKRPETVEQKIEALKQIDKLPEDKVDPVFDDTVDKVLTHYVKKVKTTLPSRPYPNRPLPKVSTTTESDSSLINFVKKYEQFSPTPYWDYKQYSIGYGTKAEPDDKSISEQEASKRLAKIVNKHKDAVLKASKKWGYNWTPNQINALTSFRFNVGNIGQLTNNGTRDNKTIARKILEYDKAGGKSLEGLTTRRKAEQAIFTSKPKDKRLVSN